MPTPPFTLTPAILALVAEIGEEIGRLQVSDAGLASPRLRRDNRIKSIQASLAIEGNTLSLDQVTAILDGKRVLGSAREVQEVKNAIAAYEALPQWQPHRLEDLLSAHHQLLFGLVDRPGELRRSGVGIQKGGEIIHLAPPAELVPGLLRDLLAWLATAPVHPLVASCVFHYEFEFIHPFSDGNGRMGRLWQTLILSRWKPILAYLPLESIIHDRQQDYYTVLRQCDAAGQSTAFIEFILQALLESIRHLNGDQVSDQVSDQVKALLKALAKAPLTAAELMTRLQLKHRPSFRKNHLAPALAAGLVELTQPDAPRSPTQQYRLTSKGRQSLSAKGRS